MTKQLKENRDPESEWIARANAVTIKHAQSSGKRLTISEEHMAEMLFFVLYQNNTEEENPLPSSTTASLYGPWSHDRRTVRLPVHHNNKDGLLYSMPENVNLTLTKNIVVRLGRSMLKSLIGILIQSTSQYFRKTREWKSHDSDCQIFLFIECKYQNDARKWMQRVPTSLESGLRVPAGVL